MPERRGERPLRVVLYEPAGRGGICHYTYQLANALADRGEKVTVVTTGKYELRHLPRRFRTEFLFSTSSSMKRLLVPALRWFAHLGRVRQGSASTATTDREGIPRFFGVVRLRLLQVLLAVRLVVLERPDIVHFQSFSRGEDFFLVRLLLRLRFPVLYTAHDLLPHDTKTPEEREAHARLYREVGGIVVHAECNREEMIASFPVDPGKIRVIPHGSYDFLLPKERIGRDAARERLGLPRDLPIVLFFGLIKRYKGLEYLVEAFRAIEERVSTARLVIVGGLFPEADGYAFYRDLLARIAGDARIVLINDYVALERAGLFLIASDIVVLPYTKTYQSGVLLAAYAAGRPVIVTDTGGLSETVGEDGTGVVVPPRDVPSLANAILRLLEDPGQAVAMGTRAQELAATKYSWDRIADQTVRFYRAVIERRFARRSRRRASNHIHLPVERRTEGRSEDVPLGRSIGVGVDPDRSEEASR